jgi:hypothetical protein
MASSVEVNGLNMNGSPRKRPRILPRSETQSKVTVVLGAQWGDEGKGKVVDTLAETVDIVCRCQVSPNIAFPRGQKFFSIEQGVTVVTLSL